MVLYPGKSIVEERLSPELHYQARLGCLVMRHGKVQILSMTVRSLIRSAVHPCDAADAHLSGPPRLITDATKHAEGERGQLREELVGRKVLARQQLHTVRTIQKDKKYHRIILYLSRI